MTSSSYFNQSKEKIINCIQHYLSLDVSDVPILYIDNIKFYKCIKNNYHLSSDSYEDIETVKNDIDSYVKLFLDCINGKMKRFI